MNAFAKLPAYAENGLLNVIVDTPRGSRSKFKYDEDAEIWRLSKILPLGASFPYDFGFIPSTKGEDGDPLDVLVVSEEPSFVGCVLPVRLIGAIEAEQTAQHKTERNDRLLGVIETEHNPALATDIAELPEKVVEEIEHFFVSYNKVEGREFRVLGRCGAEAAGHLVQRGLNE